MRSRLLNTLLHELQSAVTLAPEGDRVEEDWEAGTRVRTVGRIDLGEACREYENPAEPRSKARRWRGKQPLTPSLEPII